MAVLHARSATLTGTIVPGGASVRYYFQYGTSARYGRHTRVQTLAAGSRPVEVRLPAVGLRAHTHYHYRLVAESSAGTSEGADRSFLTLWAARGVRFSVAPRRLRRRPPWRLRIAGRLLLPRGPRPRALCRGRVIVRVLLVRGHARRTLKLVRLPLRLRHGCVYLGRLVLKPGHLPRRGKLRLLAAFAGNRLLDRWVARPVQVPYLHG